MVEEDDGRPDPEALLARAAEEAEKSTRGCLKLFFGAAPGVGKTYTMLEAGQARRREGVDVVIGWIETHGRAETERLTEGLERVPARTVEHRGIGLRDMDLDAVLARNPGLVLVDELPHTNAPGARHERRWQDVEELLAAGIDVYSTLNVQHLESVRDLVAHATGVTVRETVPDSLFDRADEIELVDLPPDDLLQRLREGKVYVPDQATRAAASFFAKGNLIVLRELALRRAAERVDAQVADWKREQGVVDVWPTRERLLAVVGDRPSDADIVRAAFRLATQLHAPWLVAAVEAPALEDHAMPERALGRLAANLELAERLGAETLVVRGGVADEVLALARARNVSRIVVGRARGSRLRRFLRGSLADALVNRAGPIEIVITAGEGGPERPPSAVNTPGTGGAWGYAWALLSVVVATGISWMAWPVFGTAEITMTYLLAVLIASSRLSRGPAIVASVLSVAAFDFFFTEPYFTLSVNNPGFIVTFAVMFVVALAVSTLTLRVRAEAGAALDRERRTAALSGLVREISHLADPTAIASAGLEHLEQLLGLDAAVVLASRAERPIGRADLLVGPTEQAVVRWTLEHGRPAGRGTDTLPAASVTVIPLGTPTRRLGLIACTRRSGSLSPSQNALLDAIAERMAVAIERAQLAQEALQAQVNAEAERTRSTLLGAISHDIRTPLASIAGSASVLEDESTKLGPNEQRELVTTIREEAQRLSRLVTDLLELTRLQSGKIQITKEWIPLEEVVTSALARTTDPRMRERVAFALPETILMVQADPVLLEQIFINLFDNAAKYAPSGPVEVTAWSENSAVIVTVEDRGPGIPRELEERIFEGFFHAGPAAGAGLGLAVCRAIAIAHGGDLTATSRPGGGASFRLVLPRSGKPPTIAAEPMEGP